MNEVSSERTHCKPFAFLLEVPMNRPANATSHIYIQGRSGIVSITVLTATLVVFAAILLGCTPRQKESPQQAGNTTNRPIIVVSILPQSYFVEQIGGDTVQPLVLVGPGQSPHTYEPTPKQMQDLAQASAWILSNTDFEINLKPKVTSLYPSLLLVDGTQGVTFRMMEAHHHEEEVDYADGENHGDDEDHNAAESVDIHDMELDRHTWLGRENAKILAAHIKDTLTTLVPNKASFYENRYQTLVKEIDETFNKLKVDLQPLQGSTVFVFHPAFGYFLDEFGIHQEAIETGGKEPSVQTLEQIITKAREEQVRVIFVQSQFPTTAAKTVADSLGAQVVPLDPLAKNWMENIRIMGAALKQAITK